MLSASRAPVQSSWRYAVMDLNVSFSPMSNDRLTDRQVLDRAVQRNVPLFSYDHAPADRWRSGHPIMGTAG